MTTTLNKILEEEVTEGTVDEEVKQISDKIQDEEDQKYGNLLEINEEDGNYKRPEGPNIFLVIPCRGQLKKQQSFLTLEREFQGEFYVGLWNYRRETDSFQRIKTWSINESKPKRIIQTYAKILKMMGRR